MVAPSAASALAMALPMPREEPVTTATLPARRFCGAPFDRSPTLRISVSTRMQNSSRGTVGTHNGLRKRRNLRRDCLIMCGAHAGDSGHRRDLRPAALAQAGAARLVAAIGQAGARGGGR